MTPTSTLPAYQISVSMYLLFAEKWSCFLCVFCVFCASLLQTSRVRVAVLNDAVLKYLCQPAPEDFFQFSCMYALLEPCTQGRAVFFFFFPGKALDITGLDNTFSVLQFTLCSFTFLPVCSLSPLPSLSPPLLFLRISFLWRLVSIMHSRYVYMVQSERSWIRRGSANLMSPDQPSRYGSMNWNRGKQFVRCVSISALEAETRSLLSLSSVSVCLCVCLLACLPVCLSVPLTLPLPLSISSFRCKRSTENRREQKKKKSFPRTSIPSTLLDFSRPLQMNIQTTPLIPSVTVISKTVLTRIFPDS